MQLQAGKFLLRQKTFPEEGKLISPLKEGTCRKLQLTAVKSFTKKNVSFFLVFYSKIILKGAYKP